VNCVPLVIVKMGWLPSYKKIWLSLGLSYLVLELDLEVHKIMLFISLFKNKYKFSTMANLLIFSSENLLYVSLKILNLSKDY
jgi:hypothetical protein